MQFRKDINGLRGLAVIAVVLFHFNANWVPGGFAGVDVFFVISGFLMTSIIFRGIKQERFSIWRFYVARTNRIIPALAVLCLVLLVLGWFCLSPMDYKTLGKHIGSSMGFLSNVIYWRESGYFDAASHEKWLLHTWSLSAEWQFYMIYPLVLVVMRKFVSIKLMKIAVLFGAVLGFIFCVIATYKWASSSYYLLPARAWEMLVGGVAYLYPVILKEGRKRLLEGFGLVLVIGSYFLLSKETPWPGYLASLPVLGAFLVIQAQRNDSFITSNFFSQSIGAWSYSIYLWHWPLVVAIYYFSLSNSFIYLGILLSVLFGFLSHKYIEKIEFRNDLASFFSCLKCKPVHMLLIVGLLGSSVYAFQGFETRFSYSHTINEIRQELVIPLRSNGYCFYSFNNGDEVVDKEIGTNCYLGSKGIASSTLLFGDSYAGHNEPFFDEVFKANDASFQSIVTNWCAPSLTKNFTGPKSHLSYEQCLMNREYLKDNMHKYKNIVFAGAWSYVLNQGQLADVEEVVNKAAKMGVNVFIMAGPYQYKENPLKGFYRSLYSNVPFDVKAERGNDALMLKANAYLKNFSGKYSKVYFIDRAMLYADNNMFNVNGISVPYSLDGGHISLLGSKYSAKYFMAHEKYDEVISHFKLD